jgi:hypothetical protein
LKRIQLSRQENVAIQVLTQTQAQHQPSGWNLNVFPTVTQASNGQLIACL